MKRCIKSAEVTPDYAIKCIIARLSIKRDKCPAEYDITFYDNCIKEIKKVADELGIKY